MIRLSDLARLQGQPAHDLEGEDLGTVEHLYLSDVDNEPRWMTVGPSSGSAPQIFAPLVGATAAAEGLRLAVTRAQVLGSPPMSVEQHLSPQDEAELERYYGLDPVAPPAEVQIMTLSAERPVPRTEMITRQVRVRRYVVTETELVEVPLKRERMVIERMPVDEGEPELIEEFTVREERVALVQTETFLVNDVQFAKELVTETEQVTVELAREQLDVTWEEDVTRG
jgi:uncharacterized protein (TIGR02271 family)